MTLSIAPLSPADLAAIESAHEQFAAAMLRRDADAIVALYTDDAVLMPPHQPAVQGRTALKAWLLALPRVTRIDLRVDRIDGRADLAYVRGAFVMTLEPDGAPPVTEVGKFLEVRLKQSNGAWLFAVDMFNSDNP